MHPVRVRGLDADRVVQDDAADNEATVAVDARPDRSEEVAPELELRLRLADPLVLRLLRAPLRLAEDDNLVPVENNV
jgi:hypothetical protein